MAFCIPKPLAQVLRKAAGRGEINVAQLWEMTSEQRRTFFTHYTDLATAKGINAGFERAMVSEHKNALRVWAKNTFNAKEKRTSKYKNLLDKIEQLSKDNLLDPDRKEGFMQDLIAEKLGATVTEDEAKRINELSKTLQKEFNKGTDQHGVLQEGYWKARKEMDNYLQSINPASRIRIATSTIGRAAMLATIKSPFINISGNTLQGISRAFERRIESKLYAGRVDRKVVKDYVATANNIFKQSGYDITRMQDLADGRKTLGEDITHAQGKGAVRLIGRMAENLVFNNLLSKPDVYFASRAFADSANLAATRIAKDEGLKGKELGTKATELFNDATSLSPTSINGRIVRSQAIADSMIATFTNDGNLAKANLAIRKALNQATGDLRVGDQIIPFVKTPANVVSATLDASGLGAVRGLKNLPGAVKEMKQGNPEAMRKVARDFFRTGFGMTIAFIISTLFDKEDFIGAYPTTQKERELLRTKNARANSLLIGDKWVSLEYFGFLGSPLVGFLYAKKYKDTMLQAMFNYATGAFSQIAELPALDPARDVLDFIRDISPEGKIDMNNLPEYVSNAATDYIRARTIPGIVYDIAKAFDASEREVDYKDPTQKVKSTIPGLRQTLPEKLDVFGEVIKGEPAYSVFLFGARVKTNRDNRIIEEIDRLHKTGNLPSITRPEKTSTRVKTFKTQVSEEKFNQALNWFRNTYKVKVDKLIQSRSYQELLDDKKKKEIDSIKSKAVDDMLKRYGYKKPKK